MFRKLRPLLLLAVVGPAAAADERATTGTIHAGGTPVAGATVWRRVYARDGEVVSAPVTTDIQGRFSLPAGDRADLWRMTLVARDGAGRIGWREVYHAGATEDEDDWRIELHEVGVARGKLLDADGRPIAGGKVQATYLSDPPGQADAQVSFSIPKPAARYYTATSAADGMFAVPGIPLGSKLNAEISAAGHGSFNASWSQAKPCELRLKPAGRVRIRFRGADDPKKLVGLGLQLHCHQTAGGVISYVSRTAQADGAETLDVADLPAGDYQLSVNSSAKARFVSRADYTHPITVTVPPGGTTEATVEVGPAAHVRGRLVNKVTGVGMPGVALYLRTGAGNGRIIDQVVTDAEGRFTGYVPPGLQGFWFAGRNPVEFVQPLNEVVKPVEVAAGATHTFPDVPLEPTVSVDGVVVGPDGQPVAGVRVWSAHIHPSEATPIRTDAAGRFTLRGLGTNEATALFARSGKSVTDGGVAVEPDRAPGPVRLTLTEAPASRLRGTVVDSAGRPIANAAAAVSWHVRGVGRGARFGFPTAVEKARTDADGRFETAALWPGESYQVTVSAPRFGQAESSPAKGVAGQVRDLGRLVLDRVGGTVAGRVVDAAGRPLAGVRVANSGDAPKPLDTTTDAAGRFELAGFFDGPVHLTARLDGYRLTAHATHAGDAAAVIRLLKAGETPPRSPPQPTAEYQAALRTFTHETLVKLWDLPRSVTRGYERNVWESMFRLDPDTARAWVEQERKRGGKQTVTAATEKLRVAEVEAAAATGAEEAVLKLEPLKPKPAFEVLLRLVRQYRSTATPKAIRLAEEAVVRARSLDLPERAWSLADLGETVVKVGRVDAGRKLIEEAATVAEGMGGDRMQGYARGRVATALCAYDLARAKKLVEPVSEEHEWQRWTAAMAVRLAPHDLPAALALLKNVPGERTSSHARTHMLMAVRIAAKDPAEAVRQVEAIRDSRYDIRYQVGGFAAVAAAVAPRDAALARQLIDRALTKLVDQRDALRSWSNFGAAAGLATWIAYHARRADYPDMDGVVAHIWALAPAGPESPASLENQVCHVATTLALTDPPAARALVARVFPEGRPLYSEAGQRREAVFALALAAPDRAGELVDQLVARARTSKDGLSGSGLVELVHVLSAPPGAERAKLLSRYVTTVNDLMDDEE